MVKPAAPWFRWGLLLWLVSRVDVTVFESTYALPYARAAELVALVLLGVGVFRLVQHADRAAGVVRRRGPESGSEPVGISEHERARQAEARARIAAAGDLPRPAE